MGFKIPLPSSTVAVTPVPLITNYWGALSCPRPLLVVLPAPESASLCQAPARLQDANPHAQNIQQPERAGRETSVCPQPLCPSLGRGA